MAASAKLSLRSDAVSATWANKKVAAARRERTAVRVGGAHYRSVRAAFEALGLPISEHGRFRMTLKASETGRASIAGHKFSVAKAA